MSENKMDFNFNFFNFITKQEILRQSVLETLTENRLTCEQLSKRTGISPATLSIFLKYKKPISFRTYCTLSDYLKSIYDIKNKKE
jgi:predicted transcriptional regulator